MANRALGAPRLTGPQPVPEQAVAAAPAAQVQSLINAGDSRRADTAFSYAILACGCSVLALVGLIVYELITKSSLSWHAFGWKFFFQSDWDPVNDQFGALPFVYGTIVSSILALVIAVPLAIGVAVFITEMCAALAARALAFTTELLAAIPSVIYGLWAIFVLVPLLRQYVQPLLAKYLGWTGLVRRPTLRHRHAGGWNHSGHHGDSDHFLHHPRSHDRSAPTAEGSGACPGSDALGDDSNRACCGTLVPESWAAIILGLGRALGETMAVTMVIGNRPEIAKSLFAPGYTMASVIANEFSEATGNIYLSALIEVGLALFMVTIIVNMLAQLLVWRLPAAHLRGAMPETNDAPDTIVLPPISLWRRAWTFMTFVGGVGAVVLVLAAAGRDLWLSGLQGHRLDQLGVS